jgi:hypothetical protein
MKAEYSTAKFWARGVIVIDGEELTRKYIWK